MSHSKKNSTSSLEDDDDDKMDIDSQQQQPPSGSTTIPFQHPDIIARLPVYLSLSLANIRAGTATASTGGPSPFPFASASASTSTAEPKPGPTLHTFHYPILPARQPLPIPESARARNVKPTMRWKSRNNIVQIELPLDNHPAAYNEYKGEELERGAERARKLTGAPGLVSTSSITRTSALSKHKSTAESEASSSSNRTNKLDRTRLESTESPQHHSDAFIGIIRDQALHLSPIDSMSQLRPTLHYLDALDDIDKQEKKRARALVLAQAAAASASDMELSGLSSGDELASGAPGGKPPSSSSSAGGANAKKAVNMTVSMRGEAGDSKRMGGPGGGGGARFGNSLGAGADARDALMGAIWDAEAERWVDLDWHDEESAEAEAFFEEHFFAKNTRPLVCKTRQAEYVCT
ncbi:hypothetical protein CF327_g242 [Tilletia walkeri]|nr:hypothetical protein CF327_g242 [Tilletia walkeri]